MSFMEIDVWQLPIPDWGLQCPACRYSLRGLPSHRCPECGTKLDMSEIVQPWHRLRDPWFSGNELPLPDFGLQCANCKRPLAGAQEHACPSCRAPFDAQTLRPVRKWFVVDAEMCGRVPLPVIEVRLGQELVPHMRSKDKVLREIYLGPRMLGSRLLVPNEFFFDLLWLIRRAELDIEEGRARAESERWACPKCGEENPGNFEMCWNCQAARTKNTE
jgi:ssDNA-binding Zn-finger/Zn-ribbon topoisomerase 1